MTVHGKKSIWIVADRRLTKAGKVHRDDAIKLLVLDTPDGVALVGYAGLGETAAGTEPSEWMKATLRGRGPLTLEQSVNVLVDAVSRELPRHLFQTAGGSTHAIVMTAFERGNPKSLAIFCDTSPDRKAHAVYFTWYRRPNVPTGLDAPPRVGVTGSGAKYFANQKSLPRHLMRLVDAHERGRISGETVAAQMAATNFETHRGTLDGTVGPNCIVAWRYRGGGGSHAEFCGLVRSKESRAVPTISRGFDVGMILEAIIKVEGQAMFGAVEQRRPMAEPDTKEMNAELSRRDWKPHDKLR